MQGKIEAVSFLNCVLLWMDNLSFKFHFLYGVVPLQPQ